jgi:hypothetical protein
MTKKKQVNYVGHEAGRLLTQMIKITNVLKRAGVPKGEYEVMMNKAMPVLKNLRIWAAGKEAGRCMYSDCHFTNSYIVYIDKKDEKKVLETFSNEDYLLGATNA